MTKLTYSKVLRQLRVVRSHTGIARIYYEAPRELGTIPRQPQIPSPYMYSPDWIVYDWRGKAVIVVETAHREYRVFEVGT